jgi:hypothetical protein
VQQLTQIMGHNMPLYSILDSVINKQGLKPLDRYRRRRFLEDKN